MRDPELREKPRPDHRAACKRLVISPDFYEAVQHPHAELVTERIERIEPDGVRTADGRLHELDVLIHATGFHADAFMRPMQVTGRGGATLAEAWADRPSAYLSISIPGFPNFFMLNGPNGPVGNFSLIEVAGAAVLVHPPGSSTGSGPTATGDLRPPEALERFEADRLEASRRTVWVTGCHSWYLDDRGVRWVWPWSFQRFRDE